MSTAYDLAVIGLGAMGSATVAHAATRGLRVLGLDRYGPAHDRGSSHGQTRIIREAYFESPAYVPLVQRAFVLWRQLEQATDRSLLRMTGCLNLGVPTGILVTGAQQSAQQHSLPYERLAAQEIQARFPGYRLPADLVGIYEPRAGILQPEECIRTYLTLATSRGAILHYQEPVLHWSADGEGVRLETAQDVYRAARLVIAPGAWAPEVFADLGLPIVVLRKVVAHFEPDDPGRFAPDRFPVYLWELPEGVYYGFPALPEQGMKIGRHDGGEVCTPQTIRRSIDSEEIAGLQTVLNRYVPGAGGALQWAVTCMYSTTPDLHFILDFHPQHAQVAVACGFSGHGFKFSSAIGEALVEMVCDGQAQHDISFLSLRRFSASAHV
jgi:sarcosine oxidase